MIETKDRIRVGEEWCCSSMTPVYDASNCIPSRDLSLGSISIGDPAQTWRYPDFCSYVFCHVAVINQILPYTVI